MTCQICGDPTSKEHSDEPVDEAYCTLVVEDEEGPGLNRTVYEFCSSEHLSLFADAPEVKA